MPQSETADVGRNGYDIEIWEEAIESVDDSSGRSTIDIHEDIVGILHERGVEDEDEIPSYRTTFTKLEKLRRAGKVTKKNAPNSSMWMPETEGMTGRTLRALRERESGTVEKVAEDLGGVDVGEVEDALHELSEDGEVESVEVGSKEIWAPLD